jgi:5-methyltetrahydropteroyltriglutamate--homocysteine methyltransferase
VFARLPFDAFLVEWDDMGRDGGYGPLRFLRPGSVAVMGLISSKVRDLESEDDLMRRMDRAAAIVGGIDRLAISTQCGFASVMVGNDTDADSQWRKLELVGRIADRLWPR